MKSFLNQCGRWQESIGLLASGALAGLEKAAVENHLADCPRCRKYFAEMAKVAAPLANWERNLAHIAPSRTAQARWANAIHRAAETKPASASESKISFRLLWRELIWPCRRTWAGLAAAWLAILVFNHSQTESSHVVIARFTTPTSEMRLALQERRQVLAEIIGPSLSPSPIEPPRSRNPQPRSDINTRLKIC